MGGVMAADPVRRARKKKTHPLEDGAAISIHLLGKVRAKSGDGAARDFAKGAIMSLAGVLGNDLGAAGTIEYLRLAIASVAATGRQP
jgi:hypothetical protein